MTPFQKSFVMGGLMLAGLGLGFPRASYGAASCTNNFLTGTYNAEVSSLSFMNVLATLNASAGAATGSSGSSGSTGSTGSSGSSGSTGSSGSSGSTGSS